MKNFTLTSPAKLNLSLSVRRKRPDGFHDIKTVFERISLRDQISFSSNRSGAIKIICDHPQVPKGSKNLIVKAVRLVQETYAIRSGITVRLKKHIPVAAGLAGGSSNAATTLVALNRLWRLRLSRHELMALGNQLGSDIAFFLEDCPWALGQGRGEKVKNLKVRTKYWHILVTPKVKMHTGDVYKSLNLKALTNKKDSANILIHSLRFKNINNIRVLLKNDLEYSILKISPRLATVIEHMKTVGVKGVSFSGSGPSLFGLTESKAEAEYLCSVLQKRYSQVFAVRTY